MRAAATSLLAALLLFAATPASGQKTSGKPATIVFKDGFALTGKIKQPTTWFSDPASGASFTTAVPGSYYTLDDGVRNIAFSPRQVHDVIEEKDLDKSQLLRLTNPGTRTPGDPLPNTWEIDEISPFDTRLDRVVKLTTPKGWILVPQRLVLLTPQLAYVDSLKHEWTAMYFTRELGPERAADLVRKHMTLKNTPVKELDKQLQVYRFLLQAGWSADADRELEKIIRAFPAERDRLVKFQEALAKLRNVEFVEGLDRAHKIGQHEEARARLKRFEELSMAANITDRALTKVQALKSKYADLDRKLKDAKRFLGTLPKETPPQHRDVYGEAAKTLLAELTFDGLPRLETFLGQALDWERALKNQRVPSQTPEELLALAMTGWLVGDGGAERNPEAARRLWAARQLVLESQKTDAAGRKQLLTNYERGKSEVGIDLVARMIPNLPPPEPHDELGTDPQKMELAAAGGGGSYHLQLPPEYHHGRPHPVLVVLHHSAEKPEESLRRWSELAAEHGYILAAPAWGKGLKASYLYSQRERDLVLETVRDLRRRFQIDSDRVYLFGCEQGGLMAWDVGLSHPDQFAAVVPMSAAPRYHGFRYWANGQYLPFYVVNGERTGATLRDTRQLFKDWIRWGYPSCHVEYKGRAAEWFTAERETILDWAGRKKRADPRKQLGESGHEFRTMRESDNRFYWVSVKGVARRHLNGTGDQWSKTTLPAWVYAQVFSQNQINVRSNGIAQVTVWFSPGMINYEEKLKLNVNGAVIGPRAVVPSLETLLEELAATGDRQRLYWARIDLKV